MQLILIYDIVHDGTRTKVSNLCLDYGLDRIQFSAFEGQLKRTQQEALMLQIKKVLTGKEGEVRLIPISQSEWAGQLMVRNVVQGEVKP